MNKQYRQSIKIARRNESISEFKTINKIVNDLNEVNSALSGIYIIGKDSKDLENDIDVIRQKGLLKKARLELSRMSIENLGLESHKEVINALRYLSSFQTEIEIIQKKPHFYKFKKVEDIPSLKYRDMVNECLEELKKISNEIELELNK